MTTPVSGTAGSAAAAAAAAAEAARKAAAERAAEAKRAQEAAEKQAAKQAEQKPAVTPAKDENQAVEGASKIADVAKAESKESPWSLTKGIGSIAKLGGALGKAAEKQIGTMKKAEDKKTAEIVEKHADKFSDEGQKALEKLEKSGKLTDTDSQGNNLRDQMDSYLEKGGDPKQAEAILQQVAHPDDQIKQVRQETCVAAENMRDMANQNPAEYFRMATDLADKGSTTLPNGKSIALSDDSKDFVGDINDPGSKASFAMQGALMEYANGKQEYDIEKDSSGVQFGILGADFHIGLGKGADIDAAKSLQEALETAPTIDPRELKNDSDADKFSKMSEAVENAKADGHSGVHIPMHSDGAKGEDQYHMMEIRKMEGDQVVLWDTRRRAEVPMSRDDFMENVGWDITADDDIGGRFVAKSGAGDGSLAPPP